MVLKLRGLSVSLQLRTRRGMVRAGGRGLVRGGIILRIRLGLVRELRSGRHRKSLRVISRLWLNKVLWVVGHLGGSRRDRRLVALLVAGHARGTVRGRMAHDGILRAVCRKLRVSRASAVLGMDAASVAMGPTGIAVHSLRDGGIEEAGVVTSLVTRSSLKRCLRRIGGGWRILGPILRSRMRLLRRRTGRHRV